MTELKAVNIMLAAIGEAPVNTLTGQSTADIIQAQAILDDVSHEVQLVGWDFNKDYDYPMTPTEDDEIVLPNNVLSIDCTSHPQLDTVQRGRKLYSRKERTTTCFTDAEYKVEMVTLLDFDDLPEAAKRYIAMRAARRFVDRILGAEATHIYSQQDETSAKSDLEEVHSLTADFTVFDNMDTARAVNRSNVGGCRYNV